MLIPNFFSIFSWCFAELLPKLSCEVTHIGKTDLSGHFRHRTS